MDQITMLTATQLHPWSMVLWLTAAHIHLSTTAVAPYQALAVRHRTAITHCLDTTTALQALSAAEALEVYLFLGTHSNRL